MHSDRVRSVGRAGSALRTGEKSKEKSVEERARWVREEVEEGVKRD